jgi:hypothetical protein
VSRRQATTDDWRSLSYVIGCGSLATCLPTEEEVKTVTLDHNCVIDALNGTESGLAIQAALARGEYAAHIVNIGASEMRERGVRPDRYDQFESLLQQAGLSQLPRLAPMGIYDVTFWGRCVFANEEMGKLAADIETVLFGNTPRPNLASDGFDSPGGKKLLNRICDVHTMWSHIHYKNDVFCTSDSNFFKESKLAALVQLGARLIVRPRDL